MNDDCCALCGLHFSERSYACDNLFCRSKDSVAETKVDLECEAKGTGEATVTLDTSSRPAARLFE